MRCPGWFLINFGFLLKATENEIEFELSVKVGADENDFKCAGVILSHLLNKFPLNSA